MTTRSRIASIQKSFCSLWITHSRVVDAILFPIISRETGVSLIFVFPYLLLLLFPHSLAIDHLLEVYRKQQTFLEVDIDAFYLLLTFSRKDNFHFDICADAEYSGQTLSSGLESENNKPAIEIRSEDSDHR